MVGNAKSKSKFIENVTFKNTLYGFRKRLQFMINVIDSWSHHHEDEAPKILEVGCGTGKLISLPLNEYGLNVKGIDTHEETIEYAISLAAGRSGMSFECIDVEACEDEAFDIVICSEVLEHVSDYYKFFQNAVRTVRRDGVVIVTVPNGTGPFEWQSVITKALFRSPLYGLVRGLLKEKKANESKTQSFLNKDSGHVNFFRQKQLVKLFETSGLRIQRYEGRTFVCGFLFSPLRWIPGFEKFNDWAGTSFPTWMVSGWMYELVPVADGKK